MKNEQETIEEIKKLSKTFPTWGRTKLARAVGCEERLARRAIGLKVKKSDGKVTERRMKVSDMRSDELLTLARKILNKKAVSHVDLATSLGVEVEDLTPIIEKLDIQYQGALLSLQKPSSGFIDLGKYEKDDVFEYGVVSDTHLACEEERLDVLHAAYDDFAARGITTVFHAGNMIDGYVARINGASVKCTTMDAQCQYVADHYPQRDGITTYFISGDDHESWGMKDSGVNYGAFQQMVCEANGRTDLKYIGHVEADVTLKARHKGQKDVIIRVCHPGMGSTIARSYVAQKIVDSQQDGELPDIYLLGHWHTHGFFVQRNTQCVMLPGMQDQTTFARKKRLKFDVGYVVIKFQLDAKGCISRFMPEFCLKFDRAYYKTFWKSDAKLVKGRLVI